VTVDQIINAAAKHFGVRPCDILGPGREKTKIRMRFITAAIVREKLEVSYPELARIFGYNDHTSAMNGVKRARRQRESRTLWACDFDAIENALLTWREEIEIEKLEIWA
jgi:chromosomal replication initiation ATPase DnaA